MQQEIIEKYNIPVPRYTSYPPANLFASTFTHEDLQAEIVRSNTQGAKDVSFYIHIPFCNHICLYCGCNKTQKPGNDGAIGVYIEYVLREFRQIATLLDRTRQISQIHFGGGSPTSIPLVYIERILDTILTTFPLKKGAEIAIECHPGYLNKEAWQRLVKMPFTRFSFGVQDFDCEVLDIVKRTQPLYPIEYAVEMIHKAHKRVNLDFIYGLPLQTAKSFERTIQKAIEICPDRIVTFSYAHVPWLFPTQKILERKGLPTIEEKQEMYDRAAHTLDSAGFVTIGMDHFVKPDDPLALSLQSHTLHRNFQGYCSREVTGQVYALGISGIAQLDYAYAQNHKSIPTYYDAIDRGILPTAIGYRLSPEEMSAREIITELMCNYRTNPLKHTAQYGFNATKLQKIPFLQYDRLCEMVADGICTISEDAAQEIVVNPFYHHFVRNVASTFDIHYDPNNPKGYSKPI